MRQGLARRAVAEGLGTGLLVATIVGSGIAAQELSPGDAGLQLLENSVATGAGLVALILAFGSVSGAHFNPVVTAVGRLLGGIDTTTAAVHVGAQVLGACAGTVLANLMFELPAVTMSTQHRDGSGLWLAELVATSGLLIVIFGLVRSGRSAAIPYAVGAYIAAAYWFTSSTAFANPAVTIGRTLTDTFAGIAPGSAAPFIAAQLTGAAVGLAVARFLYPTLHVEHLLVPHETTAEESP
jgi:arsenate reductase